MTRTELLVAIRDAGYHQDGEEFARLYGEHSDLISSAEAQLAFNAGFRSAKPGDSDE